MKELISIYRSSTGNWIQKEALIYSCATGLQTLPTKLANITDAITVDVLHCQGQEPLVHEKMHSSFCVVIRLVGDVRQKENSSDTKLLTTRSVDYLE